VTSNDKNIFSEILVDRLNLELNLLHVREQDGQSIPNQCENKDGDACDKKAFVIHHLSPEGRLTDRR